MKIKNYFILAILTLLVACAETEKKRITILYTADEHGWFSDNEKADGAAAMMHLWKEKEGYSYEVDSFLVLSGGDMWTGASASTWFKGESMYEIMHALGYDAAAIGNHEFDFSIDTLVARTSRSKFSFLAANILNKDNEVADFLQPYRIIEANGVKIGLLGLANIETPNTTMPKSLKGLSFAPYDQTIKRFVPEIKNSGADVVIIVGHICKEEMRQLTPLAAELNIPLITGGHCHDEVLEVENGVTIIESESYFRSYIKAVLEYDPKTKTASVISSEAVKNISESRDKEIAELVSNWENKANIELAISIGYTSENIEQNSPLMHDIIINSWFSQFPNAHIAITNEGSLRQDLEKGDITVGDIIGLLPFNNAIVQLNLSGKDLNEFKSRLSEMDENYVFKTKKGNMNFDENKTYQVITNDFLLSITENRFKDYDSNPTYTGYTYQDVLRNYLKILKTSEDKPLDEIKF